MLISPPLPAGSEAIVVQVLNSERQRPALKINNEPVQRATPQSRLRQLLQNRSENVVHIQADATLPFAAVVDVIDVCLRPELKSLWSRQYGKPQTGYRGKRTARKLFSLRAARWTVWD